MQWTWRMAGVMGLVAASTLIPGEAWARIAIPGTVNYLEGQVDINGNRLNTKQIGEAQIQPDEVLTTSKGKAEVLLTPGVIVRVGDNSQIRLISNQLTNPKVEVVRGEAMVEVDQKPKAEQLEVFERNHDTSIEKEGLYRFDASNGTVSVLDGKAKVNGDGVSRQLGKGKEVSLDGTSNPVKFDTKHGDELFQWSSLRSEYMAEANAASARTVYVNNGAGFLGAGWYWNPYFTSWAWLPGDGFFYSPFGYPFFSPSYVIYAPRVVTTARAYRFGANGGITFPRGGVPAQRPATSGAPARPAFSGNSFGRGGAIAMSRGARR